VNRRTLRRRWHDDLEALEVVAEEARVARDEAVALQERVGTDDEVRHRPCAAAAARAVADAASRRRARPTSPRRC
jgi:hypothetical protein